MPRPPKPRAVRHDPAVVYFKPAGVPMRALKARRKTALALVYGLAIRVEGGTVEAIAIEGRGKTTDRD